MVKILHSADLHLRECNDERWEALLELLRVGRQQQIDVLAISGDLFDRGVDAEYLRDPIRRLFTDNDFAIAILPGNHDVGALGKGRFWGADANVLTDPGYPLEAAGARIWGLPFAPWNELEVLRQLDRHFRDLPGDQPNYLLFHGQLLDAFFTPAEWGGEEERSYMPVKLAYLGELPVTGVLAGHLHSRCQTWVLANGGYFAYPGSPVAVTHREKGRRAALLWETGVPPREVFLDTYHHEEIEVKLDPFADVHPLEAVATALGEVHPRARVSLRVTGWFDGNSTGLTETELVTRLQAELGSETHLVPEFRDLAGLLDDRVARGFLERLEVLDEDEGQKERMRQLAWQAMLEAGLCG